LPAPQALHRSLPAAEVNLPASQVGQVRLPEPLNVPARHVRHTNAPCRPVNLPAAQLGQKTWPDSDCHVLGKQLVQLGALSSPENLPGGQGMHRVSSTLVLSFSYAPGVHCSLTEQNA
jgi:hypothetical protein